MALHQAGFDRHWNHAPGPPTGSQAGARVEEDAPAAVAPSPAGRVPRGGFEFEQPEGASSSLARGPSLRPIASPSDRPHVLLACAPRPRLARPGNAVAPLRRGAGAVSAKRSGHAASGLPACRRKPGPVSAPLGLRPWARVRRSRSGSSHVGWIARTEPVSSNRLRLRGAARPCRKWLASEGLPDVH